MDFFNFGFVFSTMVSVFLSLFVLAMVIGCSIDRREGDWVAKWVILVVGGMVALIYSWSDVSLPILWSMAFIVGVLKYLGVGLIYSLFEFYVDVYKSKKYWAAKWSDTTRDAQDFVNYNSSNTRLITIALVDGKIEPKINRGILAQDISAWSILWPFYAISLIVGDLLTTVFDLIAEAVAGLSGRTVKFIFGKTFDTK